MSTPQRILDNLKAMRGGIQKSDGLVLQLMRHPDATANQIMAAHEMMVRVYQSYREVYKSCMEISAKKRWGYSYLTKLDLLKL